MHVTLKGLKSFFQGVLLISFGASKFLGYYWNLGSFLALLLVIQVITGFMLVFYWESSAELSFGSVQYIIREVSLGWFFRLLHFNSASFIFMAMYLHLFNSLFYIGFRNPYVWSSGLLMLVFIMASAFLGYVLLWSQISYWACVVITSLISVLPIVGVPALQWIWGGFSIGTPTLKLFFSLHYLVPLVTLLLLVSHLYFLHFCGSTSLGHYSGNFFNVWFSPYYSVNDTVSLSWYFSFISLFLYTPYYLGDPEMFMDANPLSSPAHIVPEWYFLFAYAILRSIPSKSWGVVFFLLSVAFFYIYTYYCVVSSPLLLFNVCVVLSFFSVFFILSWLGQCVVESPYSQLGAFFTLCYYYFFFITFIQGFDGMVLRS